MIIPTLISLLMSCGEDEEIMVLPEIEIFSPARYAEFNSSDTIWVEFKVTSELNPLDASVRLFNADHNPVFNSMTIQNIPTNQKVSCQYILGELFQSEPLYYLSVGVSHESSLLSSERHPIYINRAPKVLNSVWVVTEASPDKLSARVLEPSLEIRNVFLYDGNYAGSDVHSANKQFVIAGSNFGDLSAFNTETYELEWSVPIISNPVQPYFTTVESYKDLFYVSFWDGQVIGFNRDGIESYQSEGSATVVPQQLHFNGNYLYSPGFQRSNVSQNWWVSNFIFGGVPSYYHLKAIDIEPVGFMNLSFSQTMIFANNNDGKLDTKIFNDISNIFTDPYEPFNLPDEKLNSSCVLSGLQSLLATERGIYRYIYQDLFYKISNQHDIIAIAYDELSELIWAASGNTLYALNLNGGVVRKYSTENNILNFHLLYNQ